ncbi:acyl-CoA N-acyltransferase [Artomyces pyxidatus]|uniref:Acyl-CoA N-acyltransferase n=1 Tax=Artomyces pyxidatus TaxID=48021 RepID=A0ACB8TJK8_9AGAM|nr:acyl-CoA N-acyltransferase [Artomyces pyxidatus]
MSVPAHEIIVVPAAGEAGRAELRQQCYDVRIDVFHREQGFPLDTEIDDLDETATHFLLRLLPSHTPIGTIRLSVAPDGSYHKLSRLAVAKAYRAHRFGAALVRALHAHVARPATVVCHSQLPVMPFYARFGYAPEGDQFDEDGAPHQKMVVHLPLSD